MNQSIYTYTCRGVITVIENENHIDRLLVKTYVLLISDLIHLTDCNDNASHYNF